MLALYYYVLSVYGAPVAVLEAISSDTHDSLRRDVCVCLFFRRFVSVLLWRARKCVGAVVVARLKVLTIANILFVVFLSVLP